MMSDAPRTRLTAAQRRERIEQAATELFAENGYHGTAMAQIATASGVSVPVVYDHFASKRELHRRLLERHFAELREIWAQHLRPGEEGAGQMATALDAWFGYVEAHPFAWRMLFRDTTGDPEIAAVHREVAAASREALLPLLARRSALAEASRVRIELLWEVVRAVLQGLALWWLGRRDVPREELVAAAMDGLWVGLERLQDGERWTG